MKTTTTKTPDAIVTASDWHKLVVRREDAQVAAAVAEFIWAECMTREQLRDFVRELKREEPDRIA